jgi:hypothetical protein
MRNRDFIARVFSVVAGIACLFLAAGLALSISRSGDQKSAIALKAEQEKTVLEIFKLGAAATYTDSEMQTLMNCRTDPHAFRFAMVLIQHNRGGLWAAKEPTPEAKEQVKGFMGSREVLLVKPIPVH